MEPQAEQVAYLNNPIVAQISEEEIIQFEENYFISLLQILDEEQIDKNLQYKMIFALRYLAQQSQYFLDQEQRDQYSLACIKIILSNFQLQHSFFNTQLEVLLSNVPTEILNKMEQVLIQIQNEDPELTSNPYDLLNKIQNQSMMEAKVFGRVKTLLNYTLIFPKAYTSSSYDLLHACISICQSYDNSASVYLNELEGKISTNAIQLRQAIETAYSSDLNL